MAQKIIDRNGIVSLGTVDCEDDLKPQPGISLNPPPRDGRCDCCGRHISELKPFGGPGDPLVGDFTGALLIKKFRWMAPHHEGAEKILREAEECYKDKGCKDVYEYLEYEYGPVDAEDIESLIFISHTVDKSWECRDCAVLDYDEYFKKLEQSRL